MAVTFFSSWILPPLIADFSQKFPHVQISLVEESTAKLSQFLQAGKLDLVIDNCILDNQIFEHYIYQKEQLLLAVPKNYSVNTRLQEYQIPIEEIRNGQFRSSHIPSVPLNNSRTNHLLFFVQIMIPVSVHLPFVRKITFRLL